MIPPKDGLANTDAMESAGLSSHPAGEACRNLGSDWYLPARDELTLLYTNRSQGALSGTFDTTDDPLYWSSTQASSSLASYRRFSDGDLDSEDKTNTYHVRCVRRGGGGGGGSACSNPTRDEGKIIYNADQCVMQYCNGTEWLGVGSPPDPCACGTPSPGQVCSDGSVYAGLSPDGNVKMYSTPADIPGPKFWNNGNSGASTVDTPLANCIDGTLTVPGTATTCRTGRSNTALLITVDSDKSAGGVQPHIAAQTCADLVAHGHDDWYLPAQEELIVLYQNRTGIGGFVLDNNYYWSSSEWSNTSARFLRFTDGDLANGGKYNTSARARCVRRN